MWCHKSKAIAPWVYYWLVKKEQGSLIICRMWAIKQYALNHSIHHAESWLGNYFSFRSCVSSVVCLLARISNLTYHALRSNQHVTMWWLDSPFVDSNRLLAPHTTLRRICAGITNINQECSQHSVVDFDNHLSERGWRHWPVVALKVPKIVFVIIFRTVNYLPQPVFECGPKSQTEIRVRYHESINILNGPMISYKYFVLGSDILFKGW